MSDATTTTATASQAAAGAPRSPWGRPAHASTRPAPVSLAAIQREEQAQNDEVLAARLQFQEQGIDVSDAEAKLVGLSTGGPKSSSHGTTSTATSHDVDADLAMAMMLQEQYDREYEDAINDREVRANRFTDSKVSVSMDLYRDVPKALASSPRELSMEEEQSVCWDDEIDEATQYDRRTRVFRDDFGNIITKHNPTVSGRRNRQRMEVFPLSFASGDLKHKQDIRISNKVFNDLRSFSYKHERQRARLHEKKEHSTAELAVDKKTRLLLYKMVNGGTLETVNGVISTGKESIILHGEARQDPEAEDSPVSEVAIKVFKTTLTEFKARQQFLHGDRRYQDRVGRQVARKLVKIWAEKEFANLTRMHRAGMNCPQVFSQRKHVLVMTLIGHDGTPAKKLKDIRWRKPQALRSCFEQTVEQMKILYRDCRLVHADLSEYNILYHDSKPWFIDVGQAVEVQHQRATEYLYRDCVNVLGFFKKEGLDALPSATDLVLDISGQYVSEEMAGNFGHKINASKKADKRYATLPYEIEDSSDIVLHLDELTEAEKQRLLAGEHASDDDEGDDDDDDLWGDLGDDAEEGQDDDDSAEVHEDEDEDDSAEEDESETEDEAGGEEEKLDKLSPTALDSNL